MRFVAILGQLCEIATSHNIRSPGHFPIIEVGDVEELSFTSQWFISTINKSQIIICLFGFFSVVQDWKTCYSIHYNRNDMAGRLVSLWSFKVYKMIISSLILETCCFSELTNVFYG